MPGLTTEQHAHRSTGVGGSDLPVLLGLASYKTPIQLWLEKRGVEEPEDIGGRASVRMGHKLEAVVAECFEEDSAELFGQSFKLRFDNQPRRHKDYPFMVGNIDRKVEGIRAGFEAKAWSGFSADQWGETGTDQVPLGVTAQCAHYMEVWGYSEWFVGVLLGGNDARHYRLTRDEDVADMVVTTCAKFWNHVVTETPPDLVDASDIVRLYRQSEGFMQASPELQTICRELVTVREELEELRDTKEKLEFVLKTALGPVADLLPPLDADTDPKKVKPLVTFRTSKPKAATNWQALYKNLTEHLAAENPDWRWLCALAAAGATQTKPGSRSFLVKDKNIAALEIE